MCGELLRGIGGYPFGERASKYTSLPLSDKFVGACAAPLGTVGVRPAATPTSLETLSLPHPLRMDAEGSGAGRGDEPTGARVGELPALLAVEVDAADSLLRSSSATKFMAVLARSRSSALGLFARAL